MRVDELNYNAFLRVCHGWTGTCLTVRLPCCSAARELYFWSKKRIRNSSVAPCENVVWKYTRCEPQHEKTGWPAIFALTKQCAYSSTIFSSWRAAQDTSGKAFKRSKGAYRTPLKSLTWSNKMRASGFTSLRAIAWNNTNLSRFIIWHSRATLHKTLRRAFVVIFNVKWKLSSVL